MTKPTLNPSTTTKQPRKSRAKAKTPPMQRLDELAVLVGRAKLELAKRERERHIARVALVALEQQMNQLVTEMKQEEDGTI